MHQPYWRGSAESGMDPNEMIGWHEYHLVLRTDGSKVRARVAVKLQLKEAVILLNL